VKGTFRIDPAQCMYGAATAAVRQVLTEWSAIDWFVPPPRAAAAEDAATTLFAEHHKRARVHQPALFPENLAIRPMRGGWEAFSALCARVQTPEGWDWKFSALKALSFRHSQAHGWSLQVEAPDVMSLAQGNGPGPGDLFFRVGEIVVWADPGPGLDLRSTLPPSHAKSAGWYLGYASMDVLECIEWQLAEKSDCLEGNPFLPLVRCYAAGFYPFSLGPTDVVLFGFEQTP